MPDDRIKYLGHELQYYISSYAFLIAPVVLNLICYKLVVQNQNVHNLLA